MIRVTSPWGPITPFMGPSLLTHYQTITGYWFTGNKRKVLNNRVLQQTQLSQGQGRMKKTMMTMVSCLFLRKKEISYFNLSQTTNFRLSQTERVRRRQLWIWWKWQKVLQMGRKHCGKRRNCSLRAISPFPSVFLKDLKLYTRENQCLLGKG